MRIGLSDEVRSQSVRALNRLLAHTMAIRDAYKKAHWQTSGATFYELDARPLERLAADGDDDGSNDLIVSQVVLGNELQSWFIGQHLAVQTLRED